MIQSFYMNVLRRAQQGETTDQGFTSWVQGIDLGGSGFVILSNSNGGAANNGKKTSGTSAWNAAYQERDQDVVSTAWNALFYEWDIPLSVDTTSLGLTMQVGVVEAGNTLFQPLGFFLWFYSKKPQLRGVWRYDNAGTITENITVGIETTYAGGERFGLRLDKGTGKMGFYKYIPDIDNWELVIERDMANAPANPILHASMFRQGNPSSEILNVKKTVE